MVLHLLGKKSWNVYNKDNIDKVRRDEANERLAEEERDRRMQEEDAVRRTAILRGEAPPPLPSPSPSPSRDTTSRRPRHDGPRKRRRLRGEDDTDMDMRLAREDQDVGATARATLAPRKQEDVALTDHAGNIQLFAPPPVPTSSRNAEAEAEKAKKKREYEDQFTMRFSNAAGFKQNLSKPWYAAEEKVEADKQTPRNVWGNEDPRRRDREQTRALANDPIAFMNKAQSQLKRAEVDREAWKVAKEKELRELESAQRDERRRRHRHRHREASPSADGLGGFSLDAQPKHKRRHHDHEKRHRSTSRHGSARHSVQHGSSHRSHKRRSRSP